ncbi:MAG: AMP-binding protein, partial [bacterium]|nr:AMP-binding protein [bacterium]
PEEKTIHRLFEDQVEQVPDYIAVVSAGGGESLTYNDLNGKANRLAALLIEKGVGADTIVGIMVDRSVEMIIGLLGILKAGGAYLPIDPDYPEERVEFMLKDSGAMVLLISEIAQSSNPKSETNPNDRNTNDPNKNHCFPCIVLNFEHSDFEFLRGGSRRGLSDFEFRISDFQISPTNLAYIIYTSGTTGKPKGCMITHRNVVRLMVNDRHPFDFNEADIWIMAHSYCFDFSVWEMYGALLNGGGLVIPLRGQVRDTGRFLSLVKTHSITVLNQTPTAFYHLAEMEISGPGRLDRHLRYVIFGGERLDPARLKPWTSRYSLSDIALINMYGITETTVHVTFHR